MPMHSLHAVPSLVSEIVAITADAATGRPHASARKPVARGSCLRRVNIRSTAKQPMNANTAIAGSEIGMPPHTRVRNTDEYALIIAT